MTPSLPTKNYSVQAHEAAGHVTLCVCSGGTNTSIVLRLVPVKARELIRELERATSNVEEA